MWYVWGAVEVHTFFLWKDLLEIEHLEDLCLDGWIILKWTFKQWHGEAGTELADIPRQASCAVRQAIEFPASCSIAPSIRQFADITERFIMSGCLGGNRLLWQNSLPPSSPGWPIGYIINDKVGPSTHCVLRNLLRHGFSTSHKNAMSLENSGFRKTFGEQ